MTLDFCLLLKTSLFQMIDPSPWKRHLPTGKDFKLNLKFKLKTEKKSTSCLRKLAENSLSKFSRTFFFYLKIVGSQNSQVTSWHVQVGFKMKPHLGRNPRKFYFFNDLVERDQDEISDAELQLEFMLKNLNLKTENSPEIREGQFQLEPKHFLFPMGNFDSEIWSTLVKDESVDFKLNDRAFKLLQFMWEDHLHFIFRSAKDLSNLRSSQIVPKIQIDDLRLALDFSNTLGTEASYPFQVENQFSDLGSNLVGKWLGKVKAGKVQVEKRQRWGTHRTIEVTVRSVRMELTKEQDRQLEMMWHSMKCPNLKMDPVAVEGFLLEISQDFSANIRTSKGALYMFQLQLEDYVKQLVTEAMAVAKHGKRNSVSVQDIQIVHSLRQYKF
eukprot:TRINITY_DN6509_c0_g4_i1.p2 TRINITY_DN6509_c0_g4~~TRINITY_DN6509_c0_g4_i1.p2  ORF type:complete len:384 (-),score=158.38 TRINITY_DN6509_c0_g4_i1:29-1180(-)